MTNVRMSTQPNQAALNLLFDHKFYWCEDHAEAVTSAEAKPVVDEENIPKEIPTPEIPRLTFLGKNNKKVLMLFSGGSMGAWPKELKHTFIKILQSIKLEFNDIACMGAEELGGQEIDGIAEQIQFNHLFLWGVDPRTVGLAADRFEKKQEEKFLLVNLPPLQEIQDHVEQKRQLWECIKELDIK
jgi:hypothetical protein